MTVAAKLRKREIMGAWGALAGRGGAHVHMCDMRKIKLIQQIEGRAAAKLRVTALLWNCKARGYLSIAIGSIAHLEIPHLIPLHASPKGNQRRKRYFIAVSSRKLTEFLCPLVAMR